MGGVTSLSAQSSTWCQVCCPCWNSCLYILRFQVHHPLCYTLNVNVPSTRNTGLAVPIRPWNVHPSKKIMHRNLKKWAAWRSCIFMFNLQLVGFEHCLHAIVAELVLFFFQMLEFLFPGTFPLAAGPHTDTNVHATSIETLWQEWALLPCSQVCVCVWWLCNSITLFWLVLGRTPVPWETTGFAGLSRLNTPGYSRLSIATAAMNRAKSAEGL